MSVLDFLGILTFVAIMAGGQVLFKLSSKVFSIGGASALATAPIFYAALFLYASSVLLWITILSRVPLSIAYPFTALAIIIVPLLSAWIFGDALTSKYWLGTGFIFVGALIIGTAQ
jgi:drug/metabolite transporter (DMT)-like permease